MLAILLGILKVILYILLFIIVLILSLLMIILFVPIRYKVDGEKYDAIKLDVRISWLLHIISFRYHMEEESTMVLRVFGKNVMGDKKEKKSKSSNSEKTKEVKKTTINQENELHVDEVKIDNKTIRATTTEVKKSEVNNDTESEDQKEENQKTTNSIKVEKEDIKATNTTIKIKKEDIEETRVNNQKEKKKVKKRSKKIKKSKSKKIKNDKSNKNTSKWKQIYSNIKDFLKNEDNRAVIKMVKDKVLKMLKHILPNKFHSKIIIGTGDPASTGYVVGAVSILYSVTGNKLKVIPNFEEQIFQGCFYGKGRIYLIVLLKNTLRIILDKRVRKLYKIYRA